MQGKNDSTSEFDQGQSTQDISIQNNDLIDFSAGKKVDSNTIQRTEQDFKKIEEEMLETQKSCFFGSRKDKELSLPKESSTSPQQAYSPFNRK